MPSILGKITSANIDKKSSIPYHYQLTKIIQNLISQEKWVKGDKLPSEREFCETFHISRITVRKALDSLETEGLIHTMKGVGTFVREKKYLEKWAGLPTSFTDSLVSQGVLIETQVLGLEIIPPTEKIGQELDLPSGASVVPGTDSCGFIVFASTPGTRHRKKRLHPKVPVPYPEGRLWIDAGQGKARH
jgi:DNA-binding transcriptional regulator YhcF (GntR family)